MIAKHPAPQYIVPVLALPALVNATLFALLKRSTERVAGKRYLSGRQDRQQQEGDHGDQLDRRGPFLPVACAADGL